MQTLIVNADDFGLSASVNRAIIDSFESGLINSTTIMANMPGFAEAVDLAHERGISKQIGVHLVLTEGQPLTDGLRSLPFLFDQELTHPSMKKLMLIGSRARKAIFEEYATQIEKVRKSGIAISHLDTHHQVHDAWPILQIIISLLKIYDIPKVRILNNLEKSKYPHKNIYRNQVNRYLFRQKLNFTDFMGNREDYLTALKTAPEQLEGKRIEVMVHPVLDLENQIVDRIGNREFDLDFYREAKAVSANL